MVGERDEDVAVSPAQAVGASAVGGDEFGLAQPAQGEGGGRVGPSEASPEPRRPGAAGVHSAPVACSRADSDSAIRAAARTRARLCGVATSGPPVMSTSPRSAVSTDRGSVLPRRSRAAPGG